MSRTATLQKQYSDIFNAYAAEGINQIEQRTPGAAPEVSHVCFKFSSLESYAEYVEAARSLGTVSSEEFNGKEITWVKLNKPVVKDGLTLEWLELVEPREEKHSFDGPTYVGYAVAGMKGAVKIPSDDQKTFFRYQSQHARQMAGQG